MQLYPQLDLEEFENNFSAYQRKDGPDGDTPGKTKAVKELTVIDGRRAQNCTITLSKIKMTDQELATIILNMDTQEEIAKDMCEQVILKQRFSLCLQLPSICCILLSTQLCSWNIIIIMT